MMSLPVWSDVPSSEGGGVVPGEEVLSWKGEMVCPTSLY